MNRDELISTLLHPFYENFADKTAKIVVEHGITGMICEFAAGDDNYGLCRDDRQRLAFRAAYVLERLFFDYPDAFTPYADRFLNDFSDTTSESAKRHFAKIMAHILRKQLPAPEICDKIAATAAEWAASPATRVAVRVWAVEILLLLHSKVEWLDEILPEIFETLRRNPSPAMQVCLRRWASRGRSL